MAVTTTRVPALARSAQPRAHGSQMWPTPGVRQQRLVQEPHRRLRPIKGFKGTSTRVTRGTSDSTLRRACKSPESCSKRTRGVGRRFRQSSRFRRHTRARRDGTQQAGAGRPGDVTERERRRPLPTPPWEAAVSRTTPGRGLLGRVSRRKGLRAEEGAAGAAGACKGRGQVRGHRDPLSDGVGVTRRWVTAEGRAAPSVSAQSRHGLVAPGTRATP